MIRFSKIKIIFLLSTFFYFLFSLQAIAAKLELESSISEIGVSQEFQVDLMLDTEGQDINAIDGNIIFQENLLEIKEIYTGSSIINFWIEQPAQKNNEINFSGIIPGGFSGVLSPYYKGVKPGKVFSVVFAAKKEGSGAIEIRNVKILLNDGQGTQASLIISNFQFLISNQISSSKLQVPIPKDTDPPELFTPEIARDSDIFDGKWFLVFATQDKISGMGRYFVRETTRKEDITRINASKWESAESPYLLKDQKLKSYIYLKAIDKSGNARIVYLPPTTPWYKKWLVYIIVGLFGFAVLLLIIRWLWRKIKSRK